MTRVNSRAKGKRGQLRARKLLEYRGWTIRETNSGTAVEDLVAVDPMTRIYAVEVKDCRLVNIPAFVEQAQRQAKAAKAGWLLMIHIHGTSCWLVMGTGGECNVWREPETIRAMEEQDAN